MKQLHRLDELRRALGAHDGAIKNTQGFAQLQEHLIARVRITNKGRSQVEMPTCLHYLASQLGRVFGHSHMRDFVQLLSGRWQQFSKVQKILTLNADLIAQVIDDALCRLDFKLIQHIQGVVFQQTFPLNIALSCLRYLLLDICNFSRYTSHSLLDIKHLGVRVDERSTCPECFVNTREPVFAPYAGIRPEGEPYCCRCRRNASYGTGPLAPCTPAFGFGPRRPSPKNHGDNCRDQQQDEPVNQLPIQHRARLAKARQEGFHQHLVGKGCEYLSQRAKRSFMEFSIPLRMLSNRRHRMFKNCLDLDIGEVQSHPQIFVHDGKKPHRFLHTNPNKPYFIFTTGLHRRERQGLTQHRKPANHPSHRSSSQLSQHVQRADELRCYDQRWLSPMVSNQLSIQQIARLPHILHRNGVQGGTHRPYPTKQQLRFRPNYIGDDLRVDVSLVRAPAPFPQSQPNCGHRSASRTHSRQPPRCGLLKHQPITYLQHGHSSIPEADRIGMFRRCQHD